MESRQVDVGMMIVTVMMVLEVMIGRYMSNVVEFIMDLTALKEVSSAKRSYLRPGGASTVHYCWMRP